MIRTIFKVGKRKPKNGKWREYNKRGLLVAEGMYKNGLKHGVWRYYYDTGELAIEENYQNGRMHGSYASFHMNGLRMNEGQYDNDSREGHFSVYNVQGELVKVMLFVNNVVKSETNFVGSSEHEKRGEHVSVQSSWMNGRRAVGSSIKNKGQKSPVLLFM